MAALWRPTIPTSRPEDNSPIPPWAGIGLKPRHYREVLADPGGIAWFEVHAENYMTAGGAAHTWLERLRREHPFSLHGVGLSLGGAEDLDGEHLASLRRLVERYQPGLVSEHLAWCRRGGVFFNDLLPLPLNEESLAITRRHIEQTQEALGRRILVENPSNYFTFAASTMPETEFLSRLCAKSGCGLLLDINNVHVSACNNEFDARNWLDAIEAEHVGEIHLAGHAVEKLNGKEHLRIDNHGARVAEPVWELFAHFMQRCPPTPVLVEWDTDVPPLSVLQEEAAKADAILTQARGIRGVHGAQKSKIPACENAVLQ